MILVVGATGLVGSQVCQRLAQRGEQVRALVRQTSAPEKVAVLRECGAEVCIGDLKDTASLAKACRGVHAVISTASSTFSRQEGDSIATVDEQGQLHLVEAAKAAGVDRFVFVSFRPPAHLIFPLVEAKARVEAALAGMNYTIVQASYFMEVWLSPALGFDPAAAKARVLGEGTSEVSWVSFRDVAEMCAIAVRHRAAERRTIEFGGPSALSLLAVVERFEQLGGRLFALEYVPEEALRAQFEAAEEPMQKSFAGLMLAACSGDAIDMGGVQAEFGLELTSVEEYARALLGQAILA